MEEVFIVSAARTPMGSFMGSLAEVLAAKLGAVAIKGALDKIGISPEEVEEVYMGNVLQAGAGQSPARQASLLAGLSESTPAVTINKVCSSGMKAIMIASQTIKLGDAGVMVAGGMENMSQVPHYVHIRRPTKIGDAAFVDGMLKDGLTDVYSQKHMGCLAELCAVKYNLSREDQDKFCIGSYEKSAKAWASGRFNDEVVPVEIPQRKGAPTVFSQDEEYTKVVFEKIPLLSPAFQKEGTVTAANASAISDGASALVLMSKKKMEELGVKPLAKLLSYADAAQDPQYFTTAPSKALSIALRRSGLTKDDIDFFELNEAFSAVVLANNAILGLEEDRVNVNGGAVSLGHPLGSSGARIVVTLVNVLKQNQAKYGAAAICNGGGGASAIIVENLT